MISLFPTAPFRRKKNHRICVNLLCFAALFLPGLFFINTASAQVRVDVSFKHNLYLKFEPLLATVTIENQTGRELQLTDSDGKNWFGFEIESLDGHPIPPRNSGYQLDPVQLGAGQTLTRIWNLTPLYMLGEDGSYHVKANVYVAEENRYYSSPQKIIDITEGRLLWQQTVGLPEGEGAEGNTRTISLIALRLSRSTMLYLRVEDKKNGMVYATHQLGKFVTFGAPNIELDAHNNIHVLQNAAPKVFLYTKVDLDGKVLDRKGYDETTTTPSLRHQGSEVTVVGGALQADQKTPPVPGASPTPKPASISDRPAPLPKD